MPTIRNALSSISMVTVLTTLFVMGSAGPVHGAYSSVYSDFKGEFTPEKINSTGGLLTKAINPMLDTFKVFIPPGATRATMIIFGMQANVYGAAARVDNPPQCTYNLNLTPTQAEELPWDDQGSGSLSQMRTNDYQMINFDGQIEVLDWGWGSTPLTGAGHWVYIKMLSYQTGYTELNFTVNVNVDAYTTWYNSDPFNGTQPPDTAAGPTGGTCEADWAEGCQGSDCNSGGSGGDTCNSSDKITCEFVGGTWDSVNCLCSHGGGANGEPDDAEAPWVSVTSPSNNSVVSGQVTITANAGDDVGVAGVQFKVDGSDVGEEDVSPPYGVVLDTTGLSDGPHVIMAVARDDDGNSTASPVKNITVDNGGGDDGPDGGSGDGPDDVESPWVSVTSPTKDSVVSGQAAITADAGDNVGVAGVQFMVDGAKIGEEDVSPPYGVTLDTTGLSNGPHEITAMARDEAGNIAASTVKDVWVDNGGGGASQVFSAEVLPLTRIHYVDADGAFILNPVLEFPAGLHGIYNCYAACSVDGEVYIAEADIGGNIVFQKHQEGDAVKSFDRRFFSGESNWTFDAFEGLGLLNVGIIENHAAVFFIAVKPENSDVMEGAVFTFTE